MAGNLCMAAAFLMSCAVVQADQCSSGGKCPSSNETQSFVSLLQAKLQINVLERSVEDVQFARKASQMEMEIRDRRADNIGRNISLHQLRSESVQAMAYFRAKMFGPLKPLQQKESQQAFMNFVADARAHVTKWPLRVADPNTTDRVAVTIFQPSNELDMYAFLIRWNLHLLGPKWALQVFYATDLDRSALDKALGRPTHVVWTPITLEGKPKSSITLIEYNWFRLSEDFWAPIQQEHVLIFEADSMVLQGPGCVEKYFAYDYVGAPWADWVGGNGGFTLRRKSTGLAAVQRFHEETPMGDYYVGEDLEMVQLLKSMGSNLAPRDVEKKFSVETIDYKSPCGFHKAWNYLGKEQFQHLLDLANHTMFSV